MYNATILYELKFVCKFNAQKFALHKIMKINPIRCVHFIPLSTLWRSVIETGRSIAFMLVYVQYTLQMYMYVHSHLLELRTERKNTDG